MRTLKRTRYFTANSWNNSESLAYNLKIYNVIDNELQDACYEMLDMEYFYSDYINPLIYDFDRQFNYEWQAGFNGRSGGYLVLYKGGIRDNGQVYSYPGKNIEDDEVPADVKRAFRKLAVDIVKTAEHYARTYRVVEKEVLVPKTIKVLEEKV